MSEERRAEERRADKRTPIAGVKVTYENSSGSQIEADVLDLTAGGLFIRTDAPLAVGKRIALDLSVIGEKTPWSALGRVVWARAAPEAGGPAGMGVKLIDVDEATLAAIERLVETRESTAPGVGGRDPVPIAPVVTTPVERERTLMGVGAPSEPPPPLPAMPAASPKPESPHVAPEPALSQEKSVAIDLVTQKAASRPLPPATPAESTGATSSRWVVVVLLLVVAAIAAYVLMNGFLSPIGK